MSGPIVVAVEDDRPADRASASIGGEVAATGAPSERSTEPVTGPLEPLERWLVAVVTHPEGAAAGVEAARALFPSARRLEDLVTPSRRLSALDRLGIYHHGYKARLVECVADDFRALARALPRFEALAGAYVDAHPSRSWNLVPYAAGLPAFLARAPEEWLAPLGRSRAGALARLEWAMVEVSHAPLPPPLELARLAEADPSVWAALVLRPSRALALLELAHPVVELYGAIVRGEPWPEVPEARALVATWRQHGRVWRMSLTEDAYAVLRALLSGAPLGAALEGLPAEASADVMRYFSEWVQRGFFSEIVFP